MPFPAHSAYETLIYGLPARHPEINVSTLHLYSMSTTTAVVQGEIQFTNHIRLRIMEVIDFRIGCIREYSYTLFYGDQRIRWYDPQPHPENPVLQPTFPHHYHEEPDIKHNRLPAFGLSFDQSNLNTLIQACIELGERYEQS